MAQMNIYSYLGITTDPIYLAISKLKAGQTSIISDLNITLTNYGFYEVSTEYIHEAFTDPRECYDRLLDLMS